MKRLVPIETHVPVYIFSASFYQGDEFVAQGVGLHRQQQGQVTKQILYLEAIERRIPIGVQVAKQPKCFLAQIYSRPKLGAKGSNSVLVFAF